MVREGKGKGHHMDVCLKLAKAVFQKRKIWRASIVRSGSIHPYQTFQRTAQVVVFGNQQEETGKNRKMITNLEGSETKS